MTTPVFIYIYKFNNNMYHIINNKKILRFWHWRITFKALCNLCICMCWQWWQRCVADVIIYLMILVVRS